MCTSALSNVLYAYGYQPFGNDWPNQKIYMASAVREMVPLILKNFVVLVIFLSEWRLAP